MTVTYSLQVSTSRLCTFAKLLFRWRGSVYKLLWREMLLWLMMYFTLSLLYRTVLTVEQRFIFEKLSEHCDKFTLNIPLTFILGFYLNIIYERWWQQFQILQWPDRLALYLATCLHGTDTRGRLLRRSVIRYLNLSAVLGLRMISSAVLKRFPTPSHLIEAGFLTEKELKLYESIGTRHPRHWVPCQWAASLLHIARKEDRIENDRLLLEVVKEVNDFMNHIRHLTEFDWISVPLVYTQVVTIAVYSFLAACLMGRQFLTPQHKPDTSVQQNLPTHDLYFPFFTVLQILFYLGWLKVAEVAINPFGEDEDDFEVNFIVERNLEVSYAMVDDCYLMAPIPEPDIHWDSSDIELPHTAASWGLKNEGFRGSTVDIKITPEETEIVIPSTIAEEEEFLRAERRPSNLSSCDDNNLLKVAGRASGSGSGLNHPGVNQGSMPGEMVRKLMRSVSKRKYSMSTRPVSRCDSIISNGSGEGSGSQRKISRYGNNASSRSLKKISRGYSPNHQIQKKSLTSMGESLDSAKHNQVEVGRVHFGLGATGKILTRLEAVDSEDVILSVDEEPTTLETIAEDSSNSSRHNSDPKTSVKLQVPNYRTTQLTKSHSADANGPV